MDTAELDDSTIEDRVDIDADNSKIMIMLNTIVVNTLSVSAFISRLGITPSKPPSTLGFPLTSAGKNSLDRDPVKYAPHPIRAAKRVDTMVAVFMLLSSLIA